MISYQMYRIDGQKRIPVTNTKQLMKTMTTFAHFLGQDSPLQIAIYYTTNMKNISLLIFLTSKIHLRVSIINHYEVKKLGLIYFFADNSK